MASTKETKTSSTAATTPSNPKSSTHAADPNPVPAYADQSGSRLMTLPTELRIHIYTYVFSDNIAYVREPIRYYYEVETVIADAPARIPLDRTPPQTKGTIFACRQLCGEMEDMQAAASRAYWSRNRFVFDAGQANSVLPADRDVQYVQQFCLVLRNLPNYHVHVVFEGGKWDSWFLPVGDRILGVDDFGLWFSNQDHLKDAVADYMGSKASNWTALDPRLGRGLTCKMLADISCEKEVLRAVQCQNDNETSQLPILRG